MSVGSRSTSRSRSISVPSISCSRSRSISGLRSISSLSQTSSDDSDSFSGESPPAPNLKYAQAEKRCETRSISPPPPKLPQSPKVRRRRKFRAGFTDIPKSHKNRWNVQMNALAINEAQDGKYMHKKPPPLFLDKKGRHVDEKGNFVDLAKVKPTYTLRSQYLLETLNSTPSNSENSKILKTSQSNEIEEKDLMKIMTAKYFDPEVPLHSIRRKSRKMFDWVKPGKHIKKAHSIRARILTKDLETQAQEGENGSGDDLSDFEIEETSYNPNDASSNLANVNLIKLPQQNSEYKFSFEFQQSQQPQLVEQQDTEFLKNDNSNDYNLTGFNNNKAVNSGIVTYDDLFIKSESLKEKDESVEKHEDNGFEDGLVLDQNNINEKMITSLVELPPKLESSVKIDEVESVPLFMTDKEKAKNRRIRKRNAQLLLTERIQLGLEEPPEPRVKLSNLMQVLANSAVSDPSAVEKKVRLQNEKRRLTHLLHNETRKLTPQLRRAKKRKKLMEDTTNRVYVAVFLISNLSNPQHRFKIDVHASQYNLTGCCIINSKLNVVVVEGGPKGIAKFRHLMVGGRIKQGSSVSGSIEFVKEGDLSVNENDYDFEMNEDEDGNTSKFNDVGMNESSKYCSCVQNGIVKRRNFNSFDMQNCKSGRIARRLFKLHDVPQYQDVCKYYNRSF